jgi:hypothetical protein
LIKTLDHTLPVPLLLQASEKLSYSDFLSTLHVLEKVFFRYKSICGKSATKLNELYNKFIMILDSTDQMQIDNFKGEAQLLLDGNASDELFALSLKEKLQYGNAASNRKIKYFLWTLDLYASNPKPSELVCDLSQLWIEHVSPQSPKEGDNSLPPERCNYLANLCLLTPEENNRLSNHSFGWKKEEVEKWGVKNEFITCKLSRNLFNDYDVWDTSSFDERENSLLETACLVFRADSGVI